MQSHTRPIAWALALVSCTLWISGCVTTSQGRRMQRDILALQAQFDELRSEKERLKETLSKARAEIEKLESANLQATELLRRNTADFGVQVDELRLAISQMRGAIESLQHELETRQAAPAAPAAAAPVAAPAAPPPLPSAKEDLFAYAYERQAAQQYDEARRAWKEYVTRFPKDAKADDALYNWGESFLLQGTHGEAVQVLQRILADYSRGDRVDDALFRIGEVFEAMGKCQNARAFYDELVDKHKKSPLRRKAQRKSKALERKCP